MLMPSRRVRAAGSLAALFILIVAAACGSYADYSGTPDDPFDPGPRAPGSGYGSGSGSGGMTKPGPMCEEARRRCAHEFIYKGAAGKPTQGDERIVELRGDYRPGAWMMGDAMKFDGKVWRVSVDVPWQSKLLYKFRIVDRADKETWIADPDNPLGESDGLGGMNSVLTEVTCPSYSCSDAVPTMCDHATTGSYDWRDTVLYFVFVDRFANGDPANDSPSSDFGLDPSANWQGGDWAGVTQKIKEGYFAQLGVNALWITVPMDQTDATGLGVDGDTHIYTGYHGYWPRDLETPERRFGTEAEFKTLVDEAHRAGLKVLVDYAMNHVHKDSPIWQAHKSDGWFNPLEVSGQRCVCGTPACPWEGSKATVCWFTDYLPDFNFANSAARDFSVKNALKWVADYGVDGLRLDAVKHIELSWLTELRSRLTKDIEPASKEHVYLVGETFTGDRGLIRSFVDPCNKLDGQFDFPLRIQVVSNLLLRKGRMQDLRSFMEGNDSFYGSGLMSTFLGNHDVPRSIHFAQNSPVWGDPWAGGKDKNFGSSRPARVSENEAYERLALASALLMTNRGIPLIYYGDEIGMPGAGDPDNRRFMDWNSSGYNAGQRLLLERTKKLGAIRKAHAALRRGSRITLSVTDDTWAYKMSDGADSLYVILNRSDDTKTASGLPVSSFRDELLGGTVSGPDVSVPPRSARILLP